jgi:GT2 family glycosyltransferase
MISIVVPLLNAMRFLPDTVPALERLRGPGDAGLLFVDNGSSDGSVEWLRQRGHRVFVMPGVTISALRNAGAAAVGGAIIAFVDSDCVVAGDYLSAIAGVMNDDQVAACGARYDLPDEPTWLESTWHHLHDARDDGRQVAYLPGGNFVVRRQAFESVGGFREDLATGEDAELGLRMTRAGFRIVSTPQVSVKHLGNPKSIAAFYRKQRWHALGMFGTFRLSRVDRPVLMMLAHAALLILTVVLGLSLGAGTKLLALAILPWLVPAASVAFRIVRGGKARGGILKALALYQVYYLARLAALPRALVAARR